MVAVQWRDYVLDERWAQFDLDYALCPAFVAGLNQSIVVIAWMGNAPVVCVISQESQYLHCRASSLSRSSVTFFIPSIDKTRSRTVLLQKSFLAADDIDESFETARDSSCQEYIFSTQTKAVILETYNSWSTFSGGRPSTALFPLTTMGR
jgi:hypothetical protein